MSPELLMYTVPGTPTVPGTLLSPELSDDFLASSRLPVRKTGFDAQWNRVRCGTLRVSLAGIRGGSSGQVNPHVVFGEGVGQHLYLPIALRCKDLGGLVERDRGVDRVAWRRDGADLIKAK